METEGTGINPQPQNNGNKTKILISIIVVLIIGLLVAGYFIFNKQLSTDEGEDVNQLTQRQLELEDEYESIAIQYDGLLITVKNDSLLEQLTNEQAKVQRLLEELRTLKASNSQDKKEISRLNDELSSLRKILRSYIVQIDSLNRENQRLIQENKDITDKFQETNRNLNQVAQERANLSEKVTLASKLDATNISVATTNAKGKAQKKIKKIEQIAVSFTITKNITAQPGEKTVYVRIMKPDNDVLTKSSGNTFPYENGQIAYSMKRQIEYTGEEMNVTLYWNVQEFLMAGTYRADIFADGNRIGSRSFTLQD
ncbi:CHASE3 domain sensor protein [Dysgonomonas sp. PH5-45]|uniref:hypothetical protein n=1 Tax=unclassified Dysgonomonas TaxID=2630389 RepID=UPI0024754910|nr:MULTISPECIES: hypothetical protein [unclassified Dysgonomonas]MDH6354619.1 CHASE3 domain sensor protein [Dysgonomonas sp. PH5-45]MDH6387517.1 CHASE3 domain sensor protein [Dysgonomonas sp. PH5-37]